MVQDSHPISGQLRFDSWRIYQNMLIADSRHLSPSRMSSKVASYISAKIYGSVVPTGRTTVSKTVWWAFESLLARQNNSASPYGILPCPGCESWWESNMHCQNLCVLSWCGHSRCLKSTWIRFDSWRAHQSFICIWCNGYMPGTNRD